MQSPLLVRLLQGPHTDAQFYTSPVLDLHARYSRADHLRTATPRMTDYSPWQGVDKVRTNLNSPQSAAVSLDNSEFLRRRNEDIQDNPDWLYEVLAWLPFGLLFLALLDRTTGQAEVARLMGELGANANSGRSTQ